LWLGAVVSGGLLKLLKIPFMLGSVAVAGVLGLSLVPEQYSSKLTKLAKAARADASQVSFLGDAESSLGDAESSLGDAESSLGDAESSLGDSQSSLGDAQSSLGDA
jgi:hypothetical protein